MSRYKISMRILPVLVLLSAATLARAQAPVAKGSFTLPMQARWGDLALAPGNYTFVIPRDLTSPERVEVRRDGKFVGYVLTATRDESKSSESSMELQISGDTYAVSELRIKDAGVFTYAIPKTERMKLAHGATSIAVSASR